MYLALRAVLLVGWSVTEVPEIIVSRDSFFPGH